VWLVDPLVRTLEVYRLDGESYRVGRAFRGGAPVRGEPFEAIEIDLGGLWIR
jgi:hypothetical protein